MLDQSGLALTDNGFTYQADRLTQEGKIIQSATDHTNVSIEHRDRILATKV